MNPEQAGGAYVDVILRSCGSGRCSQPPTRSLICSQITWFASLRGTSGASYRSPKRRERTGEERCCQAGSPWRPRGGIGMPPRLGCSKIRRVRRQLERCGDCAPGRQCAHHLACATQREAALAAEIGAAWAVFVRGQLDIRRPWPPFAGPAAAIALRLVEGLAAKPRRGERNRRRRAAAAPVPPRPRREFARSRPQRSRITRRVYAASRYIP
jgi:hypothetical protein